MHVVGRNLMTDSSLKCSSQNEVMFTDQICNHIREIALDDDGLASYQKSGNNFGIYIG